MYGKVRIVLSRDGRIHCRGKFPGTQGGGAQQIGLWQKVDGMIEVYLCNGNYVADGSTVAEARQIAHDAACSSAQWYRGQDWIVVGGVVRCRCGSKLDHLHGCRYKRLRDAA